jgi:hypothetical protein
MCVCVCTTAVQVIEAFGAGTAAVVSPIKRINYKGEVSDTVFVRQSALLLLVRACV